MTSDDRVGDYLEHGPAASGEAEVPDGAVHVRQVLGSAAVWGGPPPDGLDGVLGRISSERSTAGPPAEAPAAVPGPALAPGRFVRLTLVAAAAVVLLLLGGLAGWFAAGWAPNIGSETAELTGTEFAPGASAVARVRDTPSGVAIALDVSGLPPAAPGTYYEGWVKSPDGHRVSIGTFHLRDGNETVELWAGVDVARYPTLTVTVQQEGAGPQAPGKVVLRGSIPVP